MAAVLVMVPVAPASTRTTMVKAAEAPPPKLGDEQLMVPVAPAEGVVQFQPEADTMETNVVLAGTASLNAGFWAAPPPLLPIVTV